MEREAIYKDHFINEKRIKGQYFTPQFLVEAIIQRLLPYINFKSNYLRILDPSIGKGIFFQTLIPKLQNPEITYDLLGLDIDHLALREAESKLGQFFAIKNLQMSFKKLNFLTELPNPEVGTEFDLCLSNPPHNAKVSAQEWSLISNEDFNPKRYRIFRESSVYFVLKSIRVLRHGGILCYILPKPLIYSKRWKSFRDFILRNYNICEIIDIGNLFPRQLQEQIVLILKKSNPTQTYITSTWNPKNQKFKANCSINTSDAILTDNFLVGVISEEKQLIKRIFTDKYRSLPIKAVRGLSSSFRKDEGAIPLIEKINIGEGFLLPNRYYLDSEKTLQLKIQMIKSPKIIGQRIISYRTKPHFKFDFKAWVDEKGVEIPNETCICIFPTNKNLLYGFAAILQSSFIEWWLRHVVYTKQFVTSKDFDQAYIRQIRIPAINYDNLNLSDPKIKYWTENIAFPLKNNFPGNLETHFVLISALYEKYQTLGEEYKRRILSYIDNHSPNSKGKFLQFKKLYRESQKNHSNNKFDFNLIYARLKKLKSVIDELIYSFYEVSESERILIEEGEILQR